MDYSLAIYFGDEIQPRHTESVSTAHAVLTRISALLREHSGCKRVVVLSGLTRLFAVDCKGFRLPDPPGRGSIRIPPANNLLPYATYP